jgi:hypothetical protein
VAISLNFLNRDDSINFPGANARGLPKNNREEMGEHVEIIG